MGKGRQYLNEEICLQRLKKNTIRSNYITHDLRILCKKYKDVNKVIEWCEQHWYGYDKEIHLNRIKGLVAACNNPKNTNRDIYIAPLVNITKSEMEKIKSLAEPGKDNIELRKLAFMLLVLAKITDKNKIDGNYYVFENSFDFQKLAGLGKNGRRIYKLINDLHDREFIYQDQTPRSNVLRMEIKYIGEDVEDVAIALTAQDYLYPENIYLKHIKYKNIRFIPCSRCETEIKAYSNSQKYCDECKIIMRKEKEKERVKKSRNKDVKCTQKENPKEAI